MRKIKRHGSRWEAMKSTKELKNVKRKRVEERGSLLKLVGGVRRAITWSWTIEKSSIQF